MNNLKPPFTDEDIHKIHAEEHRPLTIEECNQMLDWRRKYGDLHPDRIKENKEKFFASLKER